MQKYAPSLSHYDASLSRFALASRRVDARKSRWECRMANDMRDDHNYLITPEITK
jgi:hypothetical protein